MSQGCSHCGENAHNLQISPGLPWRSRSMGHLRHYNPGFFGENSGYRDGQVSEDLDLDWVAGGEKKIWMKNHDKSLEERESFLNNRRAISSKFPESSIHVELSSHGCRPNVMRETKEETHSSLSEIVEEKDNFDTNAVPLLAEAESNHEVYHIRDDLTQSVNDGTKTGCNTDLGEDDTYSRINSPTGTDYYSCTDVDPRTNNCNKVTLQILVVGNFIFEVLSAIFDQLSSPRSSYLAIIAMVTSFVATDFCLIEIVSKCRQEKFTWRKRSNIHWFYNPRDKRFGNFKDIVGLVCGTLQFISIAIDYAFYRQHANSPTKLSLCSVVFAIGLLCSNLLCNDQEKEDKD